MLKKLDQYIITRFLGTFFFILALLMAVSIIFDISEKIDNFLSNETPLQEIVFKYYVNFVFHYANMFSSLLIFISVVLFTSKMAQRSEIIAVLAAGVSFKRFLRPFFISATLLTALALLFNHIILPPANKNRIEFEEFYFHGGFNRLVKNLHSEVEPGKIVYIESLANHDRVAYKFSMEEWKDGKLVYKLMTDRAIYDTATTQWRLYNFYERTYDGLDEKVVRGTHKDTTYGFSVEDFTEKVELSASMNSFRLQEAIDRELEKGSEKVTFFQVEMHQRTAYPMATYILTLLGVSLASRKSRGGTGLHIATGLIIAVIYIFFMRVSTVAALNAGFNPFWSVWTPNAFFALIAFWVYLKAPK